MAYQIGTGLIYDSFKKNCECPLCEIRTIIEEQFLHEFLNDAVMEDSTRMKVNKYGFCARHFDMLFTRQNKLSVALQISTRLNTIMDALTPPKNAKDAMKLATKINELESSCIICNLVEESMEKYYITIAQMYKKEEDFRTLLPKSKGVCLHHYKKLLEYSKNAGGYQDEYLSLLHNLEIENFTRIKGELKWFCDKHDYRNAHLPLGEAETVLPRLRTKLYTKKTK